MLNFNKKTLLIFLLLIAGLGLIIYAQQKATAYKKVLADNEALLIINYGQGKERWFKGEVIKDMTIRQALQAAGLAGGFTFAANDNLTAINGLSNNQEKKWHCYLNNQEIKEGLAQKTISPKDKIVCRYR